MVVVADRELARGLAGGLATTFGSVVVAVLDLAAGSLGRSFVIGPEAVGVSLGLFPIDCKSISRSFDS